MSHSTTHSSHKPDPLRPASVGGPDQAPSDHHQHGRSLKFYGGVFAVLIILLIVTVWAAFMPHLGFLNIGVALAIAGIKATLVILFFMHVDHANRLTKLFVAGTFIWLGVMFAFTFTDYLSRYMLPMSRGWNENPSVYVGEAGEERDGGAAAATAPAGESAPAQGEAK